MQYINEVTDEDGWINWHVAESDVADATEKKNSKARRLRAHKTQLNSSEPNIVADQPVGSKHALQDTAHALRKHKNQWLMNLPLRRTLSPVYGAYRNDLFDPVSQNTSAWVLHYSLTVVYPMFVHRPTVLTYVLKDRLEMFSKWPTLFHSYHFVAAAHYDMMHDHKSWYSQPEMIWHKAEAMRHLNTMISNFDLADIGITIVAVLYLDYGELSDDSFSRAPHEDPFDAPPPPFSWMQDEWNRVPPIEAHSKAVYELVRMAGGVRNLRLAALADTLCRWDLRRASINLQAPRIECLQKLDEDVLRQCLLMLQDKDTSPGSGFRDLVPGSLPSALSSVLLMLAAINRLIFNPGSHLALGHFHLRDARTVIQHRLLSLPTWDAVSEEQKRNSSRGLYECCRLTAILYSNGVLLGIPPQAGWISGIISKLKDTLELMDLEQPQHHTGKLLIWTLILACIASQRNEHHTFFKNRLVDALALSGMTSWSTTETTLASLLWSPSACGRNAATLWESLTPQMLSLSSEPASDNDA